MSAVPATVLRTLVPAGPAVVPEGFARLTESIVTAIPHLVVLTPELTLVLIVPTGLATEWRDADPAAVIASSELQEQPPGGDGDGLEAPPARLILRTGGRDAGSAPLVAGLLQRLPAAAPPLIELVIVAWTLHAGTLVGAGDFGSTIELAWRSIGPAAEALG